MVPCDVYNAIEEKIGTIDTIKCIAPLENNWYNVSFDNPSHSEKIAQDGLLLKNALVQCERANVQNSAVVYVKAPYEMSDAVVINALTQYGTVTNIRRQVHDFDNGIETGVRSCLVKKHQNINTEVLESGILLLTSTLSRTRKNMQDM